jgi:hypothetical protein
VLFSDVDCSKALILSRDFLMLVKLLENDLLIEVEGVFCYCAAELRYFDLSF